MARVWVTLLDVLVPPLAIGWLVGVASDSFWWGAAAGLALLFILDALEVEK